MRVCRRGGGGNLLKLQQYFLNHFSSTVFEVRMGNSISGKKIGAYRPPRDPTDLPQIY